MADTLAFHDKLRGLRRPVGLHLFAGEGHAFDRKTAEGGKRMVSVADPRSVYGETVTRIIALFFRKYLSVTLSTLSALSARSAPSASAAQRHPDA